MYGQSEVGLLQPPQLLSGAGIYILSTSCEICVRWMPKSITTYVPAVRLSSHICVHVVNNTQYEMTALVNHPQYEQIISKHDN